MSARVARGFGSAGGGGAAKGWHWGRDGNIYGMDGMDGMDGFSGRSGCGILGAL